MERCAWNKARKGLFHHSKETKDKIRKAGIGRLHSEEAKMKMRKPKTEEFKERVRKTLIGHIVLEETRKRISLANKGRKCSEEHKQKIRIAAEKNPNFGMRNKKMPKSAIEILKQRRKFQIFPIKDTSIEVKLQNFLKQLGIEFFTHQYLPIKNDYQCDILIPSMNTIIECFGNYWHKIPYGNPIDSLRCQELREKGFRVLIFWEKEIKVMELNDLKEKLDE